MRILVTGATGMVGSYVRHEFPLDTCLETSLHSTTRLDVRDQAAVRDLVERERPDLLVHLAALTDMDLCEVNPTAAFETNAVGTRNVCLACLAHDVALVYVSTSAVFPGCTREPCMEDDPTAPVNIYGETKLAGEVAVSTLVPRHFIVRTTWLMGGGAKDKKFVGVIARRMAAGDAALRVADGQFGSPTYARDLVRAIRALVASGSYGVHHLVNQGSCSRLDLARELRAIMGRASVAIHPVPAAEFGLAAPRAYSAVLGSLRSSTGGWPVMRQWQEALRDYYQRELSSSLMSTA